MNYSDAIAQVSREQELDKYPDEVHANLVISQEVMGAIAEGYGSRVDFGTFANCREWGLTVTAGDWTFCVYEHRTGDTLHIQGCPTSRMEPFGPWGDSDSSYDTLFKARYGQYQETTAALSRLLDAALNDGISGRPRAKELARGDAG